MCESYVLGIEHKRPSFFIKMANPTSIPREIFDQIFDELMLPAKLAMSLSCSKFYTGRPGNLVKEFQKSQWDGFEMCMLWETDQFFQGLTCGCCLLMHLWEFFDESARQETCA